jgi:hypothetical protein
MSISKVKFTELEKEVKSTAEPVLDLLAPMMGKAYIVAITRDGCPSCEKQKSPLTKLARTMIERHGNALAFTRIHVKYTPESPEESKRSKTLLGHYFYPTILVVLRTRDRGAIEYYRSVSPTMRELQKNTEIAVEIAKMIEKDAS